jgi:preprotein translocase subunit SecA
LSDDYFPLLVLDVLISTEDNFFLEVRQEIDRRRHEGVSSSSKRPVMVFFECRKALEKFYNSAPAADIKLEIRTITEDIDSSAKESAFLQATAEASITLMIRDYGRGTDFKCFDKRIGDCGGVHVIQAFFSADLAEETQIKGRTARQGSLGSYR